MGDYDLAQARQRVLFQEVITALNAQGIQAFVPCTPSGWPECEHYSTGSYDIFPEVHNSLPKDMQRGRGVYYRTISGRPYTLIEDFNERQVLLYSHEYDDKKGGWSCELVATYTLYADMFRNLTAQGIGGHFSPRIDRAVQLI